MDDQGKTQTPYGPGGQWQVEGRRQECSQPPDTDDAGEQRRQHRQIQQVVTSR